MGKSSTHGSDFSKNETPDLNYLKPFSEASECVSLFLSHGLFPLGYAFMYISFMPLDEKRNFKQKISTRDHQNKIKKLIKRLCHVKEVSKFDHEKHFPKTIS